MLCRTGVYRTERERERERETGSERCGKGLTEQLSSFSRSSKPAFAPSLSAMVEIVSQDKVRKGYSLVPCKGLAADPSEATVNAIDEAGSRGRGASASDATSLT